MKFNLNEICEVPHSIIKEVFGYDIFEVYLLLKERAETCELYEYKWKLFNRKYITVFAYQVD